ncbi:MAG: RodZ domain-containing protein [Glaciecola sp.]|jgi:cytoskeleton protein RodZ
MTDSTEVDTQFDTPGSLLSQARNAKGFTAADIAQKLRLKVGIIEALERDEILSTISLTFTKGYVRSYAKLLGLNENHIIQLFNELHISDDLTPKKMQSFSRKVSREHNDSRWMIVTYSIIALVILLSILWWVQHQSEPFFAAKSNVPEAEQSVSESLQTPVFDAIEDDSFTLNAVEIDSELTDLTNATEAEAEVEIETGSDLAPYEQAEFADETTTAIPDFIPNTNPENINQVLTVLENNDPDVESELRLFADDNESMQDSNELVELIFSFSGDCWIKITDATGNDIAYGVKKAGRVMPVIGQAPFSVILGAPRSVNVQYDGEPIDISFLPSDRTGRFVLPLQD